MNKQIKQILVFVIILIALNELCKLYFFEVSVRNHKLIKSDREFYQGSKKIDYLVLGHSRPYAAIDMSQIENGVQFCSGGETNVQTYYKLKYILEKSDKEVGTIILPYGFPTFCLSKTQVNTNSFYWGRYVNYLELGVRSNQFWNYVSVFLKSHLIPYYEYPSLRFMLFFDELNVLHTKERFSEIGVNEKQQMSAEIILNQSENKLLYTDVSLQYLKETIKLARQYNKKIVFIKYPVSPSFYENKINFMRGVQINEQPFLDVINSDNDLVQVLDYERLYGNNDMFRDPQHLNIEGKRKFTSIIVKRLGSL